MNSSEPDFADPTPADSPMVHLPRPTMWPMVMALGITMIMAGVALSSYFAVAGLIVFAIALFGWIQELLRG